MFVIGYHQNESSQQHTQNLTIERQNSYSHFLLETSYWSQQNRVHKVTTQLVRYGGPFRDAMRFIEHFGHSAAGDNGTFQ